MANTSPVLDASLSADAVLILDTLRSFSTPVAFTPLWNKLKGKEGCPKPARAKALLPELVKAGLVRRGGQGSRLSYWLPALEPVAHERICAALTDVPRSQAELEKHLWPTLLPGWPKSQRATLLKQLVQTGRVQQWPPLRRNINLFCVQPPQLELYLQKPVGVLAKELQKLAPKFASFGSSAAQVYELAQQLLQQALSGTSEPVPPEPTPDEAAPVAATANPEEVILAGMRQFTNSPLVSLTELRRSLSEALPDKATFDQAVMSLSRQGRVVLHRHDYPQSLSPAEQAELVNDEYGNSFIGIAFTD